MFDKLINMVDNALSVGFGLVTGDLPTQRQVATLIADGLSVAAIAVMFGVGEDIILELLDGDNDPN